jgi:DNA-directed RNA polymerase subunit RPC12/RpoP
MIDSLMNLLFRCSHKRLGRPVTPVTRAGQPPAETYVVCLDCGKHFSYDARNMRLGKEIVRASRPQ